MNKIEQLDVFTFKYPHHYKIGGHEDMPNRLPGTDYYIEPQWKQAYSSATESCLVKITLSNGEFGWGEAQSPITPETSATLIRTLLGPALLGQDADAIDALNHRLYHLMLVRGHAGSFIGDAIAGIDTALWDLRGKQRGLPIGALLSDKPKASLNAYVSGLRRKTLDEKVAAAKQFVSEGFAGVKTFVGGDFASGEEEARTVRAAVPDCFFAMDALWSFDLPAAQRMAKVLEELNTAWFEAPLDPEDIDIHVELAKSTSVKIGVGEQVRTPQAFQPWFKAGALQVAQPDVMRTGITNALTIKKMAAERNIPVALHVGVSTGIGVAATWQLASAIAHDLPQEHQGDLFITANRILSDPLVEKGGQLQVPSKPGIGVTVNEEFVERYTTEHWVIDGNGHRLAGGKQ